MTPRPAGPATQEQIARMFVLARQQREEHLAAQLNGLVTDVWKRKSERPPVQKAFTWRVGQ